MRTILMLLTVATLSSSAFADPPPERHDHWRNTSYPGHYVLYDQASRTYIETVDCRPLWRFTMVSNTLNTLTLYDASRGMTIRLNYEGMWLKDASASDFSFYQSGTFDKRTMFRHYDAAGAYTGSISKRHGCVWEEWFPSQTSPGFTFREKSTTAGAVELHDASRDMWVKLDATQMYLHQGQTPYAFFKSGHW